MENQEKALNKIENQNDKLECHQDVEQSDILPEDFHKVNTLYSTLKSTWNGFWKTISICIFEKYATFNGRATIKEFVYYSIFITIVTYISFYFYPRFNEGYLGDLAFRLYCIVNFGLLLPTIAVTIRRLHDTGRSGIYIVLGIVTIIYCLKGSQKSDNKYGPYVK